MAATEPGVEHMPGLVDRHHCEPGNVDDDDDRCSTAQQPCPVVDGRAQEDHVGGGGISIIAHR